MSGCAGTRNTSAYEVTVALESPLDVFVVRKPGAPETLYGMRDATTAVDRMICLAYDTTFDVVPGVRATFVDAGHILGSASVLLDCLKNGVTKRIAEGRYGRRESAAGAG